MAKVWVVRYGMPPERFLTYAMVAVSQERAVELVIEDILGPMHLDVFSFVQYDAATFFKDDRPGIVIALYKEGQDYRAYAWISEEEVRG